MSRKTSHSALHESVGTQKTKEVQRDQLREESKHIKGWVKGHSHPQDSR